MQRLIANPAGSYAPLTPGQKFDLMGRAAIAPSTFVSAAVNATWMQITGDMYNYGGGMQGWGKRLGASVANAETRNFFGRFLFPTLLHEDPRYFRKSYGSIFSRGVYAASRVLFTRADGDGVAFNYSELLSVATSAAVQNAYYPDPYRTFGNTMSRLFGAYSSDASGYVITEFAPDILALFHKHEPAKLKKIEGQIQQKIPPKVLANPAPPVSCPKPPSQPPPPPNPH